MKQGGGGGDVSVAAHQCKAGHQLQVRALVIVCVLSDVRDKPHGASTLPPVQPQCHRTVLHRQSVSQRDKSLRPNGGTISHFVSYR